VHITECQSATIELGSRFGEPSSRLFDACIGRRYTDIFPEHHRFSLSGTQSEMDLLLKNGANASSAREGGASMGSTSWRHRRFWADPHRLEIPARGLDEPRYQVIGRIGAEDVVVCFHHLSK